MYKYLLFSVLCLSTVIAGVSIALSELAKASELFAFIALVLLVGPVTTTALFTRRVWWAKLKNMIHQRWGQHV